jgi:hypothetical protein
MSVECLFPIPPLPGGSYRVLTALPRRPRHSSRWPSRRVIENKHSNRVRSMTNLGCDCSYKCAEEEGETQRGWIACSQYTPCQVKRRAAAGARCGLRLPRGVRQAGGSFRTSTSTDIEGRLIGNLEGQCSYRCAKEEGEMIHRRSSAGSD